MAHPPEPHKGGSPQRGPAVDRSGPPSLPAPTTGWPPVPPTHPPFLGSVPREGGEGEQPQGTGKERVPTGPALRRSLNGGRERGSPVQPGLLDLLFSHHQARLLSDCSESPVLYTQPSLRAGSSSPSPFLDFHPPVPRHKPARPFPVSLKDLSVQTPRPWFPWLPAQSLGVLLRAGPPQAQAALTLVGSEGLIAGKDRPGQPQVSPAYFPPPESAAGESGPGEAGPGVGPAGGGAKVSRETFLVGDAHLIPAQS
nr:PREDICTED: basic salivary proline-rich protein 4-like [Bos indicus]